MEWKILFNYALTLINDLKKCNKINFEWSIGCGTVLMLYYNHRKSKDIDIFVRDVQLIPYFSPRLNYTFEDKIMDYSEQSNFVKISFEEGEIDFIACPFLTKTPLREMKISEQVYLADTPEEIIYKKLFYRAESLKVRDIIDLAVVYSNMESSLTENKKIISSKIDLLEHKLNQLSTVYDVEIDRIEFLDGGLKYKQNAIDIAKSFISAIKIR